jgi:gliding motility-associated-like protein
MKSICVLLTIIIFISQFTITSSAQAPNTWTQKANFGGGVRAVPVGFSIGAKGYIGTGEDNNSWKNDFWEYDPSSNIWTQKANFAGTYREQAVGFSIGNYGYIGIGYDTSGPRNDFWQYDPVSNTWTQKANFGGGIRGSAVGFSIGNFGYIGTGAGIGGITNDFWAYDPSSNSWTQKASFGGTARQDAVGFSIGAKGYIGTGDDILYNVFSDFWEYDPASDTWTQKAGFGGGQRLFAVGFGLGALGYVGTGLDEVYNVYNDFWGYDPSSDTWTQKANVGGPSRYCAVGFNIGAKGYIGTGATIGIGLYDDFWEYTPSCILPAPPSNTTPSANQNICSGNSTTLSASGTGTLGWYSAATGGTWLGGGTTFTTPILTYSTTYYVQDSNSCGVTPRTGIAVTVNPLPVPIITGLVYPCVSSTGNVYSTQAGMFIYSWNVSTGGTVTGGGTPSSNTVTVTWTTPGAQNVSVNYTDSNNCTGSTPGTLTVTVEPFPVPTITGPDSACIFSAGNIFITEPGMTSYTWNVSGGGTITSGQGTDSITVTWDSAGPQYVSVLYASQYGCMAENPATFNVTVLPLPGSPGNISGPSVVCAGAEGLFYTVSPVAGAISYDWTLPPGFTIAAGNGTHTITVSVASNASSGTILVYATNLCGSGQPSPPFPVIVNTSASGDAGPDGSTCQTAPFTVTQASASNYNAVFWFSSGQGVFTDVTTLSPTYAPAQGETGNVTLQLVIIGNAPCSSDTSLMILDIKPKATANAGNDLSTCGRTPVVLSGSSASSYQSLFWTTSGSGVFNDPAILHPSYTPGTADVTAGSVYLTLHALSALPCEPDSGRILLTIARPVYVNAGPDSSLCQDQPFRVCNAIAGGYSAITWSTTGDGTFNDPAMVNPVYTPGNSDILQGKAVLIITADGVSPCSPSTDSLLLNINRKPAVHPGPDGAICQGMTFTAEGVTASDFSYFTWETNGKGILSGTTTLSPVYTPGTDETGTVLLVLKVYGDLSCHDTVVSCQVKVSVYSPVTVDAGEDQSIPYNTVTALRATPGGGSGSYMYEWEPSSLLLDDTARETRTVSLVKDTVFIVTATDKVAGCSASDSIRIVTGPGEGSDDCIVLHNVITPNGDGMNDAWIIDCIENYPDNNVEIFNRWGNEVNRFDRYDNTKQVWKGTNDKGNLLPSGTYYYVLKIKNEKTLTGWVFLR